MTRSASTATAELFPRASGILLHPTSLPGPHGIGDLGEAAFRFVDWLEAAGQSLWQILPLGPTSYGDSPYQTLSAFAGNPLLIDLEGLVAEGWLTEAELADAPAFPDSQVDYGPVIEFKNDRFAAAYARFRTQGNERQQAIYETWCREQSGWLEDWAAFAALKELHDGKPWVQWPASLALRQADAVTEAVKKSNDSVDRYRFLQWVFASQWRRLRQYAADKNIRIIGDLPIFVAHDSSDVWTNRELFHLDEKGHSTVVAGVPPDYFSKTGQLWGNPLYRWERMQQDGYDWWVKRLRTCLEQTDLVRIDHFRGFDAYWEVAAGAKTAVKGRWVPGPGEAFFAAVRESLGVLPIIAEDLGVITPAVEQLRGDFELPGMRVLQFAWTDPRNTFLPHAHQRNCVVYAGTHDNATTVEWWQNETDAGMRRMVAEYVGHEIEEPNWDLIRIGMTSVAHTFIVTMQDVLGLDAAGRMNLPGSERGNWSWRLTEAGLRDPAAGRLERLTRLGCRRPDQQADPAAGT
ncbi:MAG: 4-alpha-glucanotransferase [bacterium]